MSHKQKKHKTGAAPSNNNYYLPLQAISDEEDDMDVLPSSSEQQKKLSIPPITVLKRGCANVLELLSKEGVKDICVKKISIGTKVICQSVETYSTIKALLNINDIQHFCHDFASERAFKVVLYGLEGKSTKEVMESLCSSGFNCKDVKLVTRTRDNFHDTIYIVSFANGTVRLHDLRTKVKSLFHTIVRWDFQRKLKNNVTQCRKCQMFGHGERGCHVKLLCAICAGDHATADCKAENVMKCANCHGNHKSTDKNCPNRIYYLELRNKISQRNSKKNSNRKNFVYADEQFPNLPSQNNGAFVNSHYSPAVINNTSYANITAMSANSQQQQSNSVLFSEDEITKLTFDLILRLRDCKNKGEQFNVITQLAIKYVYSK